LQKHTPQTLGLAAVQDGLLQVRMRCGTVEICLYEIAPAERALISKKLKTNFLAIKSSFLKIGSWTLSVVSHNGAPHSAARLNFVVLGQGFTQKHPNWLHL
jgi:hypothetical protein